MGAPSYDVGVGEQPLIYPPKIIWRPQCQPVGTESPAGSGKLTGFAPRRRKCYLRKGPGRAVNRCVKSESTPRASSIPSFSITTKLRQSTKLYVWSSC